jgi:hypothetical protein
LYLGMAITYFLVEDRMKYRLVFICLLFILYLIYSFIEVTSLLKQVKRKK